MNFAVAQCSMAWLAPNSAITKLSFATVSFLGGLFVLHEHLKCGHFFPHTELTNCFSHCSYCHQCASVICVIRSFNHCRFIVLSDLFCLWTDYFAPEMCVYHLVCEVSQMI